MADATDPTTVTAPSPGLAIYVAENGGELRNPVLFLLDEENGYRMIDVFVSEWDIANVHQHSNWFSWSDKLSSDESFKPEIEAGELTRIGPMPRKHVFYRRG
jgi:hypothetical protein